MEKLCRLKLKMIFNTMTRNMMIGRDIKGHCFQKILWMNKISKLSKLMIIVNEKWTKEDQSNESKKPNYN
jgi:hypothetical protein